MGNNPSNNAFSFLRRDSSVMLPTYRRPETIRMEAHTVSGNGYRAEESGRREQASRIWQDVDEEQVAMQDAEYWSLNSAPRRTTIDVMRARQDWILFMAVMRQKMRDFCFF
jgi:hypothetical protein